VVRESSPYNPFACLIARNLDGQRGNIPGRQEERNTTRRESKPKASAKPTIQPCRWLHRILHRPHDSIHSGVPEYSHHAHAFRLTGHLRLTPVVPCRSSGCPPRPFSPRWSWGWIFLGISPGHDTVQKPIPEPHPTSVAPSHQVDFDRVYGLVLSLDSAEGTWNHCLYLVTLAVGSQY
jgi:hypothetical protein